MKKFFALLCALTLSVSLVACRSTGNNAGAGNNGTGNTGTTQNGTSNGAASNGGTSNGSANGSAGSNTGDSLVDDVERGLEDAGKDLARAGGDLEDDLDRMIDNGDLTDDANR